MDPIKVYHEAILLWSSKSKLLPFVTNTTEGSHLCRASGQGELGLVKSLVEVLDVSVDARDRYGRTPLHCASMYGHKDVVLYLLGKKCVVDTQEFLHGFTALHLAASINQLDVAKCLVHHGADINARSPAVTEAETDTTPLHMASEQGHLNMCQFLISKGAKVNTAPSYTASPLHLASAKNHLEVVKLLVQHADDINSGTTDTSAIMEASVSGSNDVVRFLLDHGADVNRPTKKNKNTALMMAACSGQLDTAKLLVERGAHVNARNDDGNSALAVASARGQAAVAEMLLANGADINLTDVYGSTALLIACCSDNASSIPSVVRILLDKAKGNLINRKSDKGGMTALHMACQKGDLETVKLLLDRGAALNAQCIKGNTPLHFASHFGHLSVTEELLKRGANKDLPNAHGCTPMDLLASVVHQLVL